MLLSTVWSFAGSTPSRTSSRKLGSTTLRWSALLGPLSPIEYVVPRLGCPSLVSRRKYGLGEYGPLFVAVQPFTCDRQVSAVVRYLCADALSPLCRAIMAAQTRPAISLEIVAGE